MGVGCCCHGVRACRPKPSTSGTTTATCSSIVCILYSVRDLLSIILLSSDLWKAFQLHYNSRGLFSRECFLIHGWVSLSCFCYVLRFSREIQIDGCLWSLFLYRNICAWHIASFHPKTGSAEHIRKHSSRYCAFRIIRLCLVLTLFLKMCSYGPCTCA